MAFLKGDLSSADLLFCTGMKNLSNIDGINLSDVKMTSELCEQFNVQYKSYDYDKKLIGEFPAVKKKRHWYYNHQGNLFHLIAVCFSEVLEICFYGILIELATFLIYI